jgi:hypothetical protein
MPRWGRWPPAPARGDVARRTSGYNRGRAWDLRRCHARPNSRLALIARTRQVTVTKIICGVDVSKARLDAAMVPISAFESFTNDAAGIAALAAFCRRHGAELAVMEATGGYERMAFLLLWQEGVPCALTNPRGVRRFAEAMGALEKTDRIDAGMIARFAIAKDVKATQPPSPSQQRLKALVARLRQVTGDLTVQKQRRAAAADAEILASLDEVIALLKRQAKTLEGEIASMIDDDPLWATLAETFRAVKGVAGRALDGRSAGDRTLLEQSRDETRRTRSDCRRQRQEKRQPPHSRRTRGRQVDPLPRRRHRQTLRRKPRRVPPKVDQSRKTKNGRPRRPRPQTPRSSQRKSTRRESAICKCNLTPQIVALP